MERRRGTRYPVRLDCNLSLPDRPTASLSGQTVNMSSCGVLVSFQADGPLPAKPKVGGLARLVVELPQAPYFRGCWLDCKCRVVRVVKQTDAHLVALHVGRYWFRPSPESASEDT